MKEHIPHESLLYIDSLDIARKNWPTLKTSKHLHMWKEWDADYFQMIHDQRKLYMEWKGRLQTNN